MPSCPSDPLTTLDHAQLKMFLDGVGPCAFVIDALPDGCFRFAGANARFERIAGRGARVRGRQPVDLFPGPAGIELEALCQQCVDTRRHMGQQFRLPTEEGGPWWSLELVPRVARTGHVTRIIGTALDITELKQHEMARACAEARLAHALERMDDAVALWDGEERLVLCNARYRAFHPSAGAVLTQGVSRAALAPHDTPSRELEPQNLGDRAAGERWLSDGRRVFTDDRPIPGGGIVEVRRDVTYLKRTERMVKQGHAILHAMLDAVDEMIAVVNADGALLAINRFGAQWLGAKRERLTGRTLDAVFDAGCAEAIGRMMDALLVSGDRQQAELVCGQRILDVSVHPVAGEDGTPSAVSLVARDVTEKRATEERAREHQHMLTRCMRIATIGEMAAAIAHELSQPITAASTFCHASLTDLSVGSRITDEVADAIAEVCREVDRAGAILNSVAGFVRRTPAERSVTVINDLVRAAADLARKDLERNGIALDLDLAADLPVIPVNAVEIEQVVLNLVRNSMDALTQTPQPVVTVRTRPGKDGTADDETIDVQVLDNGRGFAGDRIDKLFEPFFSTKPDGIGMGLAICRTIVEAHGGRIEATPAPGGGACVRFTLPSRGAGRAR